MNLLEIQKIHALLYRLGYRPGHRLIKNEKPPRRAVWFASGVVSTLTLVVPTSLLLLELC